MERQDYTGFSVLDATRSVLTVSMDQIVVSDVFMDSDVYVCSDKGAGFFHDDFVVKFAFECLGGAGPVNLATEGLDTISIESDSSVRLILERYAVIGACGLWGVANTVDDFHGMEQAGENHLKLEWTPGSVTGAGKLSLVEFCNGTRYAATMAVSTDIPYYVRIWRRDDAGTYGRLDCEVYGDSQYNTVLGALSLDLHAKMDFRYLYAFGTANSGNTRAIWSGYVKDLEIARHITDLPVRVCAPCGMLWVEDDQMYDDPERCPHCGCWPRPLTGEEGDDVLPWV